VQARIVGVGAYRPDRCVTNRELAALVGLDPTGIERRTGIRTRFWADKDQASSDLALEAGRRALAAAGIPPQRLDLIIVSTTSPDMLFPSTACLVQRGLGAGRIPAFDVAASCAGFLTALDVARAYLSTGAARTALVIAAEVKSRFLDLHDPATAIVFGDGAGAVVLTADAGPAAARGILALKLWSDGSRAGWIELPAGGTRRPLSAETLAANLHTMRMRGTLVFRGAVRHLIEATHAVLKEAGLGLDAIQHFVYHQANGRILAALAERLGLAPERLVITLPEYGNASSASLPMALERLAATGALKPDDLVLLGAFGGGLNWGAAVVRW
jgi:3-oxoacyl-[acyl-carrier-protein] synthase-3